MYKIAITGGIASGKSTVSKYLVSKGYIVVDADGMARALTASGGESIPYIRRVFGDEYILPDGSMDRAKMRQLIYDNPMAKHMLEKGVTDRVIEEIENIKQAAEEEGRFAMFFDIPLLFEKQMAGDYDYVFLVVSDYEIKAERIRQRDGYDDETICKVIGSQIPDNEKIPEADYVFYNNGTKEELYAQVDRVLQILVPVEY